MEKQTLADLRQALPPESVKSIVIREGMLVHVARAGFCGCDLNPHLQVVDVVDRVVGYVAEHGISCTREDVMLLWLTACIFDGMKHEVTE